MRVKSTPVLAPHFEASMAFFFFFSIEMGIKNRREMRSVGLSTDFRVYASFSVHENDHQKKSFILAKYSTFRGAILTEMWS